MNGINLRDSEMKVKPFQMSESTSAALAGLLVTMRENQRQSLMTILSILLTEVEIYSREKAFEELRQNWSDAAATMFRFDARPQK